MDPEHEIEFELLPYIRVYKSGRVERLFGNEVAPPSLDPLTGVLSKDTLISPPDTGVSARLYLPPKLLLDDGPPKERLPVLVYFHGGGFCLCTASYPLFHSYLNSLVAQANIIAVSVDYRLAPEHPIPAAYDDSWAALRWVASHAAAASGGAQEEWLADHADLRRIFLAGDSAGANIAHTMALRAGADGLGCGVAVIRGVVLFHPYFLSTDPVESERIDPVMSAGMHSMWKMACPSAAAGSDDHRINPLADGAPRLSGLACERVLVCVGGEDVLRDRGREYCEGLRGSGWGGEVELVESEGEGHVFHLKNPACEEAVALNRKICHFLMFGL